MEEPKEVDKEYAENEKRRGANEGISKAGLIWFFFLQVIALVFIFLYLLDKGTYGWTLFCVIPFSIGLTIGVFVKTYYSKKLIKGTGLTLGILFILSLLLLFAGFEGAICIIMAAGIIGAPALAGMFVGYLIRDAHIIYVLAIIFFTNSSSYVYDINDKTKVNSVTSRSMQINASAETVWRTLTNPVGFSEINNLFFKSGVVHPVSMQLQQTQDGCFLFCNLDHGKVSLPVTEIDTFRRLRFSVPDTIAPMRELSLYDSLDAKHLRGYFAASYGEFEIEPVNNNSCRLIARTSYTYKITPAFYWRWWSDYLVNVMHKHVLEDVKTMAEKSVNQPDGH